MFQQGRFRRATVGAAAAALLLCLFASPAAAAEEYFFYSLQFNTFLNAAVAKDNYRTLSQELPDTVSFIRLEERSPYLVLRAGLFATHAEAKEVYSKLRPLYDELIINKVAYEPDRVVAPAAAANHPDEASASPETGHEAPARGEAVAATKNATAQPDQATAAASSQEDAQQAVEQLAAAKVDSLVKQLAAAKFAHIDEAQPAAEEHLPPQEGLGEELAEQDAAKQEPSQAPLQQELQAQALAQYATSHGAPALLLQQTPAMPAPAAVAEKPQASEAATVVATAPPTPLQPPQPAGPPARSAQTDEVEQAGALAPETTPTVTAGHKPSRSVSVRAKTPEAVAAEAPEAPAESPGAFERFYTGLPSLFLDSTYLLVVAAILALLLLLAMGRRRAKRRSAGKAPPELRPRSGKTAQSPSPVSGPGEERLREHLRANIQQISNVYTNIHSVDKGINSIYVTSCFHGEGKTTAAVQIAYGLAMNNNTRVLLVDANPRSPALHGALGLEPAPGLMELLRGEEDAAACIQTTFLQGIDALAFGDPKDRRPDLLQEGRLQQRVQELSNDYRYIVVDGNSYLASPDSPLVANCFGACILIVEAEKTKWEVVQQAASKMQMMESEVLGAVLNKRKFYIPRLFYGRSR